MARDFDAAIERFQAAESLEIHTIEVKWTALENFDSALKRLTKALRNSGSLDRYTAIVSRTKSALYELRKTPIAPYDAVLGLGDIVDDIAASHAQPAELWAALVESINVLLSADHPVSDLRGLMVKHDLLNLIDADRLVVVSSTKYPKVLQNYLKVRDADYDLVGLRELRTVGFWDVGILLSTQQRPYHMFETKEDVAKEISWIYFAPAASHLVVITWSAGQKFDLGDYVVRPEIKTPTIVTRNSGSVTYWGSAEVRLVRKVRRSALADVSCRLITIEGPSRKLAAGIEVIEDAGEWVVAFAKSLPPNARVLVPDDYGVFFETVKDPAHVALGSILVLREDLPTDDSGNGGYDPQRDEVRKIAESLARRNYSKWREVSDRFKKALATAASDPTSAQRLREAGIQLPEYYLRVHTSSYYIGPKSLDRYRTLCLALSIPFQESDYTAISEVRGLHLQAGNRILDLMKQRLEVDRSWETECRDNHFAIVEDRRFGRVFLTKVLSNEESECLVSELGQRRWALADGPSEDEEIQD